MTQRDESFEKSAKVLPKEGKSGKLPFSARPFGRDDPFFS